MGPPHTFATPVLLGGDKLRSCWTINRRLENVVLGLRRTMGQSLTESLARDSLHYDIPTPLIFKFRVTSWNWNRGVCEMNRIVSASARVANGIDLMHNRGNMKMTGPE
ncbi:hypothetical protein J3458_009183 [Metarhizium acridum]|uniref:uncharacterized protein n=1 Tax=Metarhizium acridum TaxID=92637 RepID=UPI001C6CAF26|nr:hypothetical protein J3458_009183 [Metarhizium acridum]